MNNNVSNLNWTVKSASLTEWQDTIVQWMKDEAWDNGINDEIHFFNVDSEGFFIGYLDDKPISCLSIVNFNSDTAHLGHYIVHPDYRGQDWGVKTWHGCFNHLGERFSTLDGMPVQAKNYAEWGYETDYKTYRYQFIKSKFCCDLGETVKVTNLTPENLVDFMEYDKKISGIDRSKLFQNWFSEFNRTGYLVKYRSETLGAIGIRKSIEGYRIGPFYTNDINILETLLLKALEHIPEGTKVTLDVPEFAIDLIEILRKLKAVELFYTLRMFRGQPLQTHKKSIQAIASLELG